MKLGHIFLLTIAMLLSALTPVLSQTDDPIAWYESFFRQNRATSVDTMLARSEQQLSEAITTGDRQLEAFSLKELGLIHLTQADKMGQMDSYETALDYFIRTLAIEDSINDAEGQVFTYLAMARVFEQVGNFQKSDELLKTALGLNEKHDNINVLALLLNESGKVKAAMGQIEEALEAFQIVLEYSDELRQPTTEANALFNLGHLYQRQGRYKEALRVHKKALAIRRVVGDKELEALSLNDIGELYWLMKNYDRALANHVVALEIRKELNDQRGVAESYNNIGALYSFQKNYTRAIANLSLGLESARDVRYQEGMRKSFEYLSLCNKELGNYKNALGFSELYIAINELIINERNERQLLETENRYTIEKKESEILKLEQVRAQRERQLATQRKIRNSLFALIGLGLIIGLLVLYLYIVKQRANRVLRAANAQVQHQNETLQELNAMKDKFFSIISHDLKGPLNSLTSFSSLLINHTDHLSKEEIQLLAKDLDQSIKNLFALLENLLDWSRSQTGTIDFKPDLFDLAAVITENRKLLAVQAKNKNITIDVKAETQAWVWAHRPSINTVVRNLIANAIKFTPNGGTVTASVSVTESTVEVSIADTGVGMPPEVLGKLFRIDTKHSTRGTANEKGTGLGLILCKEFVTRNGGEINVTSTLYEGSVFSFKLPVDHEMIERLRQRKGHLINV